MLRSRRVGPWKHTPQFVTEPKQVEQLGLAVWVGMHLVELHELPIDFIATTNELLGEICIVDALARYLVIEFIFIHITRAGVRVLS